MLFADRQGLCYAHFIIRKVSLEEIEMAGISNNTHYVSAPRTFGTSLLSKLLIFIGGFNSAIFFLGIILCITNYNDMRDSLGIAVFSTLLFMIPLVIGIRMGRLVRAARRYEPAMRFDEDGMVTVEELSGRTGVAQETVRKELDQLFQKGYMINCVYERNASPPHVRLLDPGPAFRVSFSASMGEDGPKFQASAGVGGGSFVTVHCSSCGAENRIRAGMSGKCSYCGSQIKG